jgi:hypothetical protein
VRTGRIGIDDVVEVLVRGRLIVRRVTKVNDGIVCFNPLSPAAGWRHANARDVVTHWRKTGRRDAGSDSSNRSSSAMPAGREPPRCSDPAALVDGGPHICSDWPARQQVVEIRQPPGRPFRA